MPSPCSRGGSIPQTSREAVEKGRVRTVVDAAGAVALHVAVAADRARARSLAADVAAQEQQVDDLAHRVDAVLVLREAEAPGDDHPLRRQVRVGELADVGLGDAGALDEVGPGGGRDERAVLVEAVRVVLDELSVEHGRVLLRRLEDGLGDAAQQRQVAADPHLHVHRPDLGRVEGRHVDELVRDDRPPRSRFDQRVDVDELRAAPVGLGEPGEHPRRVRGRVVAHQPDRIGLRPVVEVDRALAAPDRRRHRPAARLVAHVRAVRQVVRAELAHPELVEEGRLVAEPPGGVERAPGAGSPAPRRVSPTSANASSQEIGSYLSLAGS